MTGAGLRDTGMGVPLRAASGTLLGEAVAISSKHSQQIYEKAAERCSSPSCGEEAPNTTHVSNTSDRMHFWGT